MTVTLIWLLIAAGSGNTSPSLIAKFATEAQCQKVADEILARSTARRQLAYLNGICVPAMGMLP